MKLALQTDKKGGKKRQDNERSRIDSDTGNGPDNGNENKTLNVTKS